MERLFQEVCGPFCHGLCDCRYFSFSAISAYLNKGKKLAHETSNKNLFELEGMNRQLDEIDAVLSQMQERDDNIYRSIFEADPYPTYKRKPGTGGNPESFEKYKNYAHADLVLETSKKI